MYLEHEGLCSFDPSSSAGEEEARRRRQETEGHLGESLSLQLEDYTEYFVMTGQNKKYGSMK
jgi:hypothetical protein